jgi:hypothetical protein
VWRNSVSAALLFTIIPLSIAAQSSAKANKRDAGMIAAVRAVLYAQRDAWNRGDVAGYMDGYSRSADTSFPETTSLVAGSQSSTVIRRTITPARRWAP